MDFDQKEVDFEELAIKRRSSILKLKDDTTKLQSQNVGLKRRVSFHNLRKVQEFNKNNGDLEKEVQEELLHLTNNSDHIKNDNAMSTSFVAGVDFYETEADASMTLTFLNGPQAISTPHGNRERLSQRNSNANITFNVFKAAEIGVCAEQESIQDMDLTQPVSSNIDDKTCILFDNIKTAMNKNDNAKSAEMFTDNNTTFNVFKSVENPSNLFLQSAHSSTLKISDKSKTDVHGNAFNPQENTFLIMNNILGENASEKKVVTEQNIENINVTNFDDKFMDTSEILGGLENVESNFEIEEQDAKGVLSESRWTIAFYDNESSELLSKSKAINKSQTLFDELMDEDNKSPINMEDLQNQSVDKTLTISNKKKFSDPSWCLEENSQFLLDDININSVNILQLSATGKHTFQVQSNVEINNQCSSKLQTNENNTYNISSLYRSQQTLQELTQFTKNIIDENKCTSINTFTEVKESRAFIEAKEASYILGSHSQLPADKSEIKIDNVNQNKNCINKENKENESNINILKKKQSLLNEITIPDFGDDKSHKQNNIFCDSIMAQSNLLFYHSQFSQDTMNTKQIGRLAFNEPTEPFNIFDNQFTESISPTKSNKVVSNSSFGSGSKRKSLHARRRSLIVLSKNNNDSTLTLQKPFINSPSLIATNESFNATVMDLEEITREYETAKLFHERKKRIYDAIESLFSVQKRIKDEEKLLNSDLNECFQELLKKINQIE